jgi:hypothetical protein
MIELARTIALPIRSGLDLSGTAGTNQMAPHRTIGVINGWLSSPVLGLRLPAE